MLLLQLIEQRMLQIRPLFGPLRQSTSTANCRFAPSVDKSLHLDGQPITPRNFPPRRLLLRLRAWRWPRSSDCWPGCRNTAERLVSFMCRPGSAANLGSIFDCRHENSVRQPKFLPIVEPSGAGQLQPVGIGDKPACRRRFGFVLQKDRPAAAAVPAGPDAPETVPQRFACRPRQLGIAELAAQPGEVRIVERRFQQR